jgi:hypothetical protein
MLEIYRSATIPLQRSEKELAKLFLTGTPLPSLGEKLPWNAPAWKTDRFYRFESGLGRGLLFVLGTAVAVAFDDDWLSMVQERSSPCLTLFAPEALLSRGKSR